MNGYVQDERYIAGEHMDVRRDCVSFARPVVDRVGVTKLRSLPLPHHRTYGFPYPAVESESLRSQ